MKTSLDPQPSSLALTHPPLAGRPNQTAHSESSRAQTQGADITLTTSEGDRITISQSSISQQLRSESATQESSRLTAQSMTARGMSIAVQGDLNDQEVRDLTSLLDDLGSIATDFFNGNLQDAVNGAMNIGDMGSISKLEATFSRTSLLSNYLLGPHPIPSLAGAPADLDLNKIFDTPGSTPGVNMTDLLSAQWQQFLEELTNHDFHAKFAAPPIVGGRDRHDFTSPKDQPRQQSPQSPSSAGLAGEQMVARSKETMHTHPRLTPLMPSVAELAINQAKNQFYPGLITSQFANDIGTAFNKGLNGWLL